MFCDNYIFSCIYGTKCLGGFFNYIFDYIYTILIVCLCIVVWFGHYISACAARDSQHSEEDRA